MVESEVLEFSYYHSCLAFSSDIGRLAVNKTLNGVHLRTLRKIPTSTLLLLYQLEVRTC